ncbi:MAG: DUF3576 domain-containing protein [Candidatus Nitrospinota bacterium M3_3B_026]
MTRPFKFPGWIALAALFAFSAGCESLPQKLVWKNEETDKTAPRRGSDPGGETVAPAGLLKAPASPITPEEARRTALSRPKVVKIQEMGDGAGSGSSYYDVVEEKSSEALAPTIDENARPVRVVTYDNNAVEKDYLLSFGVVWERMLEAFLDMPLETVDRSSGIIITDWIYDEKSEKGLLALSPLSALEIKIRYRYTIRALDRGVMTRVMVVPFAQVIEGRRWAPARPSIVITNRLFDRIDSELAVPLPRERS